MADDPRYPIGKFSFDGTLTEEQKSKHLEDIEQTPARLRAAVRGLSDPHLDTPYREGGWTVRQVVHHVPESHMNSYIRFKLALTEEEPTIRPYLEDRWAKLPDATTAPVELSLILLEFLHKRWMLVLRAMKPEEWKRTFRHPEIGLMTLEKALALYSWHGRHHVAHVTSLRERMGW
jgi:DinB superfamily